MTTGILRSSFCRGGREALPRSDDGPRVPAAPAGRAGSSPEAPRARASPSGGGVDFARISSNVGCTLFFTAGGAGGGATLRGSGDAPDITSSKDSVRLRTAPLELSSVSSLSLIERPLLLLRKGALLPQVQRLGSRPGTLAANSVRLSPQLTQRREHIRFGRQPGAAHGAAPYDHAAANFARGSAREHYLLVHLLLHGAGEDDQNRARPQDQIGQIASRSLRQRRQHLEAAGAKQTSAHPRRDIVQLAGNRRDDCHAAVGTDRLTRRLGQRLRAGDRIDHRLRGDVLFRDRDLVLLPGIADVLQRGRADLIEEIGQLRAAQAEQRKLRHQGRRIAAQGRGFEVVDGLRTQLAGFRRHATGKRPGRLVAAVVDEGGQVSEAELAVPARRPKAFNFTGIGPALDGGLAYAEKSCNLSCREDVCGHCPVVVLSEISVSEKSDDARARTIRAQSDRRAAFGQRPHRAARLAVGPQRARRVSLARGRPRFAPRPPGPRAASDGRIELARPRL